MQPAALIFLAHTIDNKPHACWYRQLSATHIEVLGVGLMETVACEGRSPEAAARFCLEEFIRRRMAANGAVIAVPDLQADLQSGQRNDQ